METYYFLTTKFDYADEFDVEVIWCGSATARRELLDAIRKAFELRDGEDIEIYFGTNEFITLGSPTTLVQEFNNATEISAGQFQDLCELFNVREGGDSFTFGTCDNVVDIDFWRSEAEEDE
jgi:hypothetical protein